MLYRAVYDATAAVLASTGQLKSKRDLTPEYMKEVIRKKGLTGQPLFDAIDRFMAKVRPSERS
jgi:hypothetical protein